MNRIYKLLLAIAVLTIAVGCEFKCDEDDFIDFNMTQDRFFYDTKIVATKINTVGYVDAIVPSDSVKISAFANKLIVTPIRKVAESGNNVNTPDTKLLWNYDLFNIENYYPADYEVACKLELCCYSCVGIDNMSFDDTNQYLPKIDNSDINKWYVYYDNSWWQWDVTKAQISWGSLNP